MADITTTKRIIELPDASQTITNDDYFAIDNANGDTGKIPASLFTSTSREADQYDPEETYAVGDLCINNNVLYRCTTAISTAEVWTPAHWTQTTLANEISTLNSSLTEKANKSWTYVDSKTGAIAIDLPNAWNEILITCNVHGETNRTTVVIPYELVSSNYNGFSFGNFGTSYFVGNVKTTSVVLTNANWGGTDVRTNTDVTVYYR